MEEKNIFLRYVFLELLKSLKKYTSSDDVDNLFGEMRKGLESLAADFDAKSECKYRYNGYLSTDLLAFMYTLASAQSIKEGNDLYVKQIFWAHSLLHISNDCANLPSPASQLAKMRHAENKALKEEAIKFWLDNIDRDLSAQKAADELLKVVPLSHKKLAEIVSAEKKKARH